MLENVMTTPRQLRAAISTDFEKDLKELGDLLGHASITQTVEFILKAHLKAELERARRYTAERLKGK